MQNLWKAIFMETLFQEWAALQELPPKNKAVRAAYARAFRTYNFKFEVVS